MNLPRPVKNVICYIRRSRQDVEREERLNVDTLHEQRKMMTKELSKFSFHYDMREEIGSGDTIVSRPIFSKIVREIELGKVDCICVKDFARLGRGDMEDSGRLMKLFMMHQIVIITPNKIYDVNNPQDLRMIRFEMFFYREELETIKERLYGGRKNSARDGRWVIGGQGVPYGYTIDPKTIHLTPYIEGTTDLTKEAQVVQQIYHWYIHEDIGIQRICTRLKNKGIPTPNGKVEWKQIVVKRMLSNPAYIGTVTFNTTKRVGTKKIKRPESEWIVVEKAHPSLVSDEDFKKAKQKMAESLEAHPISHNFEPGELAGLLICPSCGNKMLKHPNKSYYTNQEGEKIVYYKDYIACLPCKVRANYSHVLDELVGILKEFKELDTGKLKNKYESMLQASQEVVMDEPEVNIEEEKGKIHLLRKSLLDKFVSGFVDENIYMEKDREYKDRLQALEEIEEKPKEEPKNTVNISDIRLKMSGLYDIYHSLKKRTKRNDLLRLVFDKVDIEILEKGAGKRPAKFKLTPHFRYNFFK